MQTPPQQQLQGTDVTEEASSNYSPATAQVIPTSSPLTGGIQLIMRIVVDLPCPRKLKILTRGASALYTVKFLEWLWEICNGRIFQLSTRGGGYSELVEYWRKSHVFDQTAWQDVSAGLAMKSAATLPCW
jgi:hypothetical protein